MSNNQKEINFDLQKSIRRVLICSSLFTLAYAYLLGCGKKERDIKKDLVDHKIISLADDIGLADNGDNPLHDDEKAIENGKIHYDTMCVVCHGQGGRGNTGPDILDDISLHGSDNFSVYNAIMNGIKLEHMKLNPPRGKMPGYKNILGSRKTLEIMAWIEAEKTKVKKEYEE